MAARPLVLPEPYSGEGSWEQWIYHFRNVVAVNDWNEEAQLKWLKVRLTGRAQTAFQRLPAATQADLGQALAALKERFEPTIQKTRFQAELQTRRRKKGEDWADLADDLRRLADKAYPDLEDKARERLALNAYLGLLDNPQVAFGVKQKSPGTLDAAIAATLELESYLSPCKVPVSSVTEEDSQVVSAVSYNKFSNDKLVTLVERLVDRVEKLEVNNSQANTGRRAPWRSRQGTTNQRRGISNGAHDTPLRRDITCWNCGRKGHVSRQCLSPRKQLPEN